MYSRRKHEPKASWHGLLYLFLETDYEDGFDIRSATKKTVKGKAFSILIFLRGKYTTSQNNESRNSLYHPKYWLVLPSWRTEYLTVFFFIFLYHTDKIGIPYY